MAFDFRMELSKMTPRISKGGKIYVFCAFGWWEHVCRMYKYAFDISIDDYIDGFIDNDKAKHGSVFHGKQVYA